MGFDISEYAKQHPELSGKTVYEAAQHAFDKHELGKKYGYANVSEWINDEANASTRNAINSDMQANPNAYKQLKDFSALPSRGAYDEFSSSVLRRSADQVGNMAGLVAGFFGGEKARNATVDLVKNSSLYPKESVEMAQGKTSNKYAGLVGDLVGGLANDMGLATLAPAGMFGKALVYGVPTFHGINTTLDTKRELDEKGLPDSIANALTQGGITAATGIAAGKILTGGSGKLFAPKAGSVVGDTISANISPMFKNGLNEFAASLAKNTAANAGVNIGSRFLLAENSRRMGLTEKSGLEDVYENFGPDAVSALILGALPAGHDLINRGGKLSAISSGAADPLARQSAANEVYRLLNKSGNGEAAVVWDKVSRDAIANKRDINVKQFVAPLEGELLPPEDRSAPGDIIDGEVIHPQKALPASPIYSRDESSGPVIDVPFEGSTTVIPGDAAPQDNIGRTRLPSSNRKALTSGFDPDSALEQAQAHYNDVVSKSADPSKDSEVAIAKHYVDLALNLRDAHREHFGGEPASPAIPLPGAGESMAPAHPSPGRVGAPSEAIQTLAEAPGAASGPDSAPVSAPSSPLKKQDNLTPAPEDSLRSGVKSAAPVSTPDPMKPATVANTHTPAGAGVGATVPELLVRAKENDTIVTRLRGEIDALTEQQKALGTRAKRLSNQLNRVDTASEHNRIQKLIDARQKKLDFHQGVSDNIHKNIAETHKENNPPKAETLSTRELDKLIKQHEDKIGELDKAHAIDRVFGFEHDTSEADSLRLSLENLKKERASQTRMPVYEPVETKAVGDESRVPAVVEKKTPTTEDSESFAKKNPKKVEDANQYYGLKPEEFADINKQVPKRDENLSKSHDQLATRGNLLENGRRVSRKAFDAVVSRLNVLNDDHVYYELKSRYEEANKRMLNIKSDISSAGYKNNHELALALEEKYRAAKSETIKLKKEHDAALRNKHTHGLYFPDLPGEVTVRNGAAMKTGKLKIGGKSKVLDKETGKVVDIPGEEYDFLRIWDDPKKNKGFYRDFLADDSLADDSTFPAHAKELDERYHAIDKSGFGVLEGDATSEPTRLDFNDRANLSSIDPEGSKQDRHVARLDAIEEQIKNETDPTRVDELRAEFEKEKQAFLADAEREAAEANASRKKESPSGKMSFAEKVASYDSEVSRLTDYVERLNSKLKDKKLDHETEHKAVVERDKAEAELYKLQQFGEKYSSKIEEARSLANLKEGELSSFMRSKNDTADAIDTPSGSIKNKSGIKNPTKTDAEFVLEDTNPSRFRGEGIPESAIPEDLSLRTGERVSAQEQKLSSDDNAVRFEVEGSNSNKDAPDASRAFPSKEGARVLLENFTSKSGDFDGTPLSREEIAGIFKRYPGLRNEFPRLSPRESANPFAKGFLGYAYKISEAMRLAKNVFNELSNRMSASLGFVKTLDDISAADKARLVADGISLDHVKAYYDNKLNKVVVILDRHSGTLDVLQSVLHEGGHNAEKMILGNRADKFFADFSVRMNSHVVQFLKDHGLADTPKNRAKASREVFFDMLGDVSNSKNGLRHNVVNTMMNKLVSMFRDGLRALGEKLGIKGLDVSYTEGEINNMIHRFVGGSHTLGTDSLLGHGGWENFKTKFVDKFSAVKDLEDKYRRTTSTSFYSAMGTFKGRQADFINRTLKPHFDAMGKSAQASGLTVNEYDRYMYAKSAIERNEARKAEAPHDAKLAARIDAENKVHADYISKLEGRIGAAGVKNIEASRVELNSMLNKALDHAVAMGVYTRAEANRIQKFKHYVSFKDDTLFTSKGHLDVDISKGPIGRITGDYNSTAGDVIGSTLNTIRGIVSSAEKNYALMHLHDFAFANPTMNDFRVVKGTGNKPSNSIGVRVNGEQRWMIFDNEKVFRAIKSMDDKDIPAFMQKLQKYNRFRIISDLALNPYFAVRNILGRDTIFAAANLYTHEKIGNTTGAKISRKVLCDIPSAVKGLYGLTFGKGSKEWGDLYTRYQANGGKMGLAFLGNDTNFQDTFANSFNLHGKDLRGKFLRASKAVNTWAEHINDISENAVRLSTFKHAVEAGLSDKAAAQLAKDVAINFDRHGSWGQYMNALYIYSNAYTQGVSTTAKMIRRNPKAFAKVGAGLATLGFMSAFMQRAAFGDDYDKIPEHVRSDNLVMMTVGSKSLYGKVALPGELLPFFNLGQSVADVAAGKSIASSTLSLLSNVIQSLNPLGRTVIDGDMKLWQSALQTATPSAFRPVLEALVLTNDEGQHMKWTGAPIKHGDEAAYLLSSIAGGVGNLLKQGFKTATGQAETVNDIPLVSGFVGQAPSYMQGQPTDARYNEAAGPYVSMLKRYNALSGIPEKKAFVASLEKSDLEILKVVENVDMQLRKLGSLKKKYKEAGNTKMVDEATKRMTNIKKQFIDFYKKKAD